MSNNEICQFLENIYRNISTESGCTLEKIYNAFVNIIKNEKDIMLTCIKMETSQVKSCDKRVQTPGMSPPRPRAWTFCLFTPNRYNVKRLKNNYTLLE